MNKKIIIAIIGFLVLGIIVGLLVKYCIDLKEKREQEEEHKRLMEESIQEINYINENSNFIEIELMGQPTENFDRQFYGFYYSEGNYMGGYYCWQFNGKYCINEISIHDEGANLLGITLGDSYDKAIEVMNDREYTFTEKYEDEHILSDWDGEGTAYKYKKAYVTIIFTVSDDNIIREIFIKIWDPYNTQWIG